MNLYFKIEDQKVDEPKQPLSLAMLELLEEEHKPHTVGMIDRDHVDFDDLFLSIDNREPDLMGDY